MEIKNTTGYVKLDQSIEYFWFNVFDVLFSVNELPEKAYFTDCNETNKQIIKKITDFLHSEVEIKLSLYKTRNPWSSVIGYTDEKNKTIHINSRKINSLGIPNYSAHILHEALHFCGFKHSFRSNKKRPFSVPYFIAYLLSSEKQIEDLLDD